nr:hypothetical protein [Verrucosispora sioxanthis]
MSAGSGRWPGPAPQRTWRPSAYVCTSSKVSRSVCGSGAIENTSRAGPSPAWPFARDQISEAVTTSVAGPCMPDTGRSSFRVVIVGAQPSTDSGYTSAIGGSSGIVISIFSVRTPGRSSGTTNSSFTALPCCASVGVKVTPSAHAVAGQSSTTAVARAATSAPRRRRLGPCVIAIWVPIRVHAAGTGSGHTR